MYEQSGNTEPNVSTRERLGLPKGFTTEKGSVYSYGFNGRVHRDKFDGTSHDMGIAVFVDDTPDNLDVFTRLGTQQSHLPPEQRKKAYILQLENTEAGKSVKSKVYNTAEVTDPDNLAFALINGENRIVGWIPASLEPKVGSYVFEMDKYPDGTTSRHPGHRVSSIAE